MPNQGTDFSTLSAGSVPDSSPVKAADIPKTPEQLAKETPEPISKLASLTAVMASSSDALKEPTQPSLYAEEGAVNRALDKASVVDAQMQQLGTMSAEQRAKIGAKYGGGVGLQTTGIYGGIIGAAIGAVAGRSAGMVQSGEHEDNKRLGTLTETLHTTGVVNDSGSFTFDDGGEFYINPDKSARLENISAMTGKPNRTIYEIDQTNPFSRRAAAVARPLAYFVSQGLMGHKDPKNPRDTKVLDNSTGLLVNALQNGANSIEQVYSRAHELTKKFGVTEEGMRSFFDANKSNIPDVDAVNIRRGLDILFAGTK